MEKLKRYIEKQFAINRGKNLLADDYNSNFHFIEEAEDLRNDILRLSQSQREILIDFVTDRAIEAFCELNQYYSFDTQSIEDLRVIYKRLVNKLIDTQLNISTISIEHYTDLNAWLKKTNPFAIRIYKDKETNIAPVPCSEYSAKVQMQILRIKIETIQEPVLDIGCGASKKLIRFLENNNLISLGIDRLVSDSSNSKRADWLEFNYGTKRWGTIVSNLGFSNHFKHHHLRDDGKYIEYAKKYVKILDSLKVGGKFYYAPDLPFIEQFLDRKKFDIIRFDISESDYKGVRIKRLK